MLASISVILGILMGLIVLAVADRGARDRAGESSTSKSLPWFALAFGILAVVALAAGLGLSPQQGNGGLPFNLLSMVLSLGAIVIGIGSLRRGDRSWRTWAGLVSGLLPGLFWLAFAAGHLVGPGE